MTTITAQLIEASVPAGGGPVLTTMQLRYPRFIHAEFMTHRVFSRNASSSRAVPVARLIQDVLDDPAVPLFWGRNQRGMQAGEECEEQVIIRHGEFGYPTTRYEAWMTGLTRAVNLAQEFAEAGYHKQICNRLLEPFAHINVVVTATEWENFLALRDHDAAEPHIRLLAQRVRHVLDTSRPAAHRWDEWHLPFVTEGEHELLDLETCRKISVARCARVSYLTRDGRATEVAEDVELHDRLLAEGHMSPFEHQAVPGWAHMTIPQMCSNLQGWVQHRKIIETDLLVEAA